MHGGKRRGAGRKPGAAWAGASPRPRSIRELANSRVREVLTTANDPIAVLVEIANDPAIEVQYRIEAAKSAAPFMFPRLSATVVATAPMTAKDDTAGLVERLMERFAKVGRTLTIDAQPEPVSAE